MTPKPEVKAYIDKLRAETVCELCGAQPIEWHNEDHDNDRSRRVGRMVLRGESLEAVKAEITACQALCRGCHMVVDGRYSTLKKTRFKPGRNTNP